MLDYDAMDGDIGCERRGYLPVIALTVDGPHVNGQPGDGGKVHDESDPEVDGDFAQHPNWPACLCRQNVGFKDHAADGGGLDGGMRIRCLGHVGCRKFESFKIGILLWATSSITLPRCMGNEDL